MTPYELHKTISESLEKKKASFLEDLRVAYEVYIHTVSEKDVASSLESCVMLMNLCAAFPVKRVMDMGSGLSSYVFRLFKQKYQPELEVHSIDTEAYWLNKSRDFVLQNGLDPEGFLLWDEADDLKAQCDLIFFDVQDYPTRLDFLPPVIKRFCGPEAKILLDDMHWPRYRQALSDLLWQRDYMHINLENETRDEFGRYAGLLCGVTE
jgi:hypothetical protein